jgi:hypothetical protein
VGLDVNRASTSKEKISSFNAINFPSERETGTLRMLPKASAPLLLFGTREVDKHPTARGFEVGSVHAVGHLDVSCALTVEEAETFFQVNWFSQ